MTLSLVESPCCPRDSEESSSTPQSKSINSLVLSLLYGPTLTSIHAVAAAKLLQSCPTLCDPIHGSLPGSPIHGIFQARVLEWVAISFSILKSRDIILLTEVYLVKAMVFPVVMYRCESWTIEKTEHLRIDAFEVWCWRRFLRVPWTSRRSNQSILMEISPEYSLEELMLKLKLQYFGHLMQGTDS